MTQDVSSAGWGARTARSLRSRRTGQSRSACRPRARPSRATSCAHGDEGTSSAIVASSWSRRCTSGNVACAAGCASVIVLNHCWWRVVHASPSSYRIPCRNSSFESRCRQRIRSTRIASRARIRSRSASSSRPGHTDRVQLAREQQPREQLRVAAIGLDPLSGPARNLRRRRDHALDLTPGELPRQPVPGRARLIRRPHRTGQTSAEPGHTSDVRGHRKERKLARLHVQHAATTFVACTSRPTRVLAFAMAGLLLCGCRRRGRGATRTANNPTNASCGTGQYLQIRPDDNLHIV